MQDAVVVREVAAEDVKEIATLHVLGVHLVQVALVCAQTVAQAALVTAKETVSDAMETAQVTAHLTAMVVMAVQAVQADVKNHVMDVVVTAKETATAAVLAVMAAQIHALDVEQVVEEVVHLNVIIHALDATLHVLVNVLTPVQVVQEVVKAHALDVITIVEEVVLLNALLVQDVQVVVQEHVTHNAQQTAMVNVKLNVLPVLVVLQLAKMHVKLLVEQVALADALLVVKEFALADALLLAKVHVLHLVLDHALLLQMQHTPKIIGVIVDK